MRTYKPRTGPFLEGVYYEDQDFEDIAIDELRKADLLPSAPEPIRIERFIGKRNGITPDYNDLPPGVLGYTRFGWNGPVEVVVSRTLSDEESSTAERRINTTLAHEAGHILLHSHLFAMQPSSWTSNIFREEVEFSNKKILCKTDVVGLLSNSGGSARYDGRWWEFQANKMIGALLLPRPLVMASLNHLLSRPSLLGIRKLDTEKREEAARWLAEVFDVNPEVGRRRISEMFNQADNQLTL